jgi:hypothetical protein
MRTVQLGLSTQVKPQQVSPLLDDEEDDELEETKSQQREKVYD